MPIATFTPHRRVKPAGVSRCERVVIDIRIPIGRLAVHRVGNRRIRRYHPADAGVINPPVHVHKTDAVQLLLIREPAIRDALQAIGDRATDDIGGVQTIGPIRGTASQPESIEAHHLGHGSRVIRDGIGTAEMIGVDIARSPMAIRCKQRVYRHHATCRHDAVAELGVAGVRHHLEQTAHVGGGAVACDAVRHYLLIPLQVRAVAEGTAKMRLLSRCGVAVSRCACSLALSADCAARARRAYQQEQVPRHALLHDLNSRSCFHALPLGYSRARYFA